MLEAQYKRDLNHNYLVFPVEAQEPDFRIDMLRHHRIGELLPCMIRRVNHELLFTFEISGKQPLSQVFERRPMGAQDVRNLMKTVSAALEHMKEYLLDMEMLVLDPEYIFCREETGEYFFCCIPGGNDTAMEGFQKLSAYILKILDNKDQEAVRLGYTLYRSTMEENFSLMQLLEETAAVSHPEPATVEAQEPRPRQEASEERKDVYRAQETEPYGYGLSVPAAGAKPAEGANKKRASAKRIGLFGRGESKKEGKKPGRRPMGEELASYARETAFSYGGSGCLLQSEKDTRLTFAPASFPFLLGSLECGVDGYVDEPGVSHFHARIEKENGVYYVMDLNSAKGTFVNGTAIAPESRKELAFGDRIGLGTAVFKFLHKNNGN